MQNHGDCLLVNKGPWHKKQMSGFYTGLACLVLFDARGVVIENPLAYTMIAMGVAILLVSLKFIPSIFHRPQQLVDTLCGDLLCITAHGACISTIQDQSLRHACALHSICFITQQRFMGRVSTVVHSTLLVILLTAYAHGPRISDVKQFMLSAVCPHALEILAQVLSHTHRVAVMWMADS